MPTQAEIDFFTQNGTLTPHHIIGGVEGKVLDHAHSVQSSSVADIDDSTVDETYDADTAAVIADLRTKVNFLISKLEASGIIETI